MIRWILAMAGIVVMAGAAAAAGAAANGSQNAVAQALQDGYEVKAAFSDNNGGAYMILQKGTSAYMCHSNPNQTCEKLN